ncbi:hypothetical protein V6Z11_A07G114600 [Gossypium hirsutum]
MSFSMEVYQIVRNDFNMAYRGWLYNMHNAVYLIRFCDGNQLLKSKFGGV